MQIKSFCSRSLNHLKCRRLHVFFKVGHIILALPAVYYIIQWCSGALIDPGGGLQFLCTLFLGLPMSLMAGVFYATLILLFIFKKPTKTTFQEERLISPKGQILFIACLILDAFYIIFIFPSIFWVFYVLEHMVV